MLEIVLSRHGRRADLLLQILRELQSALGWLSRSTLSQVAAALDLPVAQVQGVSGFYRFLHERPVGTYRVLFSDNVTDRMLGSEALLADLCQRLGCDPGQDQRRRAGQCGQDLVHRPVRPGSGPADQSPPCRDKTRQPACGATRRTDP